MSTNPRSQEELLEYGQMFQKAFLDYELSIEDIVAGGDKAIARYITRGKHEGEFLGIPPAGNRIEHSVIIISLIKDGKIVAEWEEADRS